MSRTIFNFLEDLTTKKTNWNDIPDSDKKEYGSFMVNRWISMDPGWLEVVSETQRYTGVISPRINYLFYKDILPKKKLYLKYTKVQSEKETSLEKLAKVIAPKLKISTVEALEYIDILMNTGKTSEIKSFLKGYGMNDAEIEKMVS